MNATTNIPKAYRSNHYVPQWYQHRFIPNDAREKKLYYLNKDPGLVQKGSHRVLRSPITHWGPSRCFVEEDLYTTKFRGIEATDIEQYFFGAVDSTARSALDYFVSFTHPSADSDAFQTLVPYMSLQKLRTPKGLGRLSEMLGTSSKNSVLINLQRLSNIYCALWTECVWSIADAANSATKFLLSDHPVTVYNKGCFPMSPACQGYCDPEIWQNGTHTIYPLNMEKCLILTNVSWLRNCYGSPIKNRPNPNPFREAMFNFMQIQTGRKLAEREVLEINHIIKSRALRFVAASNKDWLYPERVVGSTRWDRLGDGDLLMPDPRSATFGGAVVMGFEGGGSTAFDEYGRRPWDEGYDPDRSVDQLEWSGFHAYRSEFARRFGRLRRGSSYEFHRLETEDSEEYHRQEVQAEGRWKAAMRAAKRRD